MSTIQIQIDLDDSPKVLAFSNFLREISGGKATEVTETPAPAKKKKADPTVETKAEPEAKAEPTVETKAEPEAKAEPTVETKAEASISIVDVRALVAKNSQTHRDAIKAKLTELGAPNVTTLAVEKYTEFVDFLQSLA